MSDKLSIVTSDELDAMESSWANVPDVTLSEPPTTALAVKAHACFVGQIVLADAIANRCVELGVTGPVTKDNYDKAKIIVGLCRKSRGEIEKARKLINEDALAWTRAVNSRAKELIQPIESIEDPFKAGIKAIDDEKARIKREKEEAESQAIIGAENARKAAEEAERQARFAADQARLAAERKAFEEQQAIARKESERIQAEAAKVLADERAAMEAERKRLEDLRKFDDMERAKAQEKIAKEAAAKQAVIDEANRIERERIAGELAALKHVKDQFAEQERQRLETDRKAREDLERIERETEDAKRKAARAPDADKLRIFAAGFRAMQVPAVGSDDARGVLNRACIDISKSCDMLERFE